ncbi:MAG: hypothetical protein CFH36_01748 [Alphaproteobacteria bacterium MarineAlpha9_Bin6]|nr:MAG: hypothetical protein CFH36_01748 [Alphaproteobacteria bacterium MarineAlpha9_Bin6]
MIGGAVYQAGAWTKFCSNGVAVEHLLALPPCCAIKDRCRGGMFWLASSGIAAFELVLELGV